MAYKVLKLFQTGTANGRVEKLSAEDTVDVFDTQAEAESKKSELEAGDPTRKFQIIEI